MMNQSEVDSHAERRMRPETVVYVSGPMSGYSDYNFPAFYEAEKMLLDAGYDKVVNPAHRGVQDGWAWSDYLRVDIKDLMDCTHIHFLDGWFYSNGARLELHVARQVGIIITEESATW